MTQSPIGRQIFIGGCSRSGTTLLGAMLGTHDKIICTPESHFKIDILRSSLVDEAGGVDVQAAADYIKRHWRFKLWDTPVDPESLASEVNPPTFAALMSSIVYKYSLEQGQPDASLWIDHTPENISYATSLFSNFPEAKMIHIIRDGRAVAASIMPLDWGPNSIIKASRWWVRMVSFGLAAESHFGPDLVFRVKYESLLADPEGVLRPLCDFLEIPYHPQILKATGFTPPAYTSNQHTLIGQKPDPALAGRWQQKLRPRQIEIFENQTRDYLDFLGYPLQFGLKAKAPTFSEIQRGKAKELLKGELANKIKWLIRSYPVWVSRDFYRQARLSDTKN